MRVLRVPVLAVLAIFAAPARAEGTPEVELPIAFGVSSPQGWLHRSFGGSAYIALGPHHALRGNLAYYENAEPLLSVLAIALGGDIASHTGRINDAGAALVWYPRRVWDGFTLEAGVLRRGRRTRVEAEFADVIKTRSTTYAGRAMIGWSWLYAGRVFIAISAGVSVGREVGEETAFPEFPSGMSTTTSVTRPQVDAESYLRIGFAFGGGS